MKETEESGTNGKNQTMNRSETEPLATLRYLDPEVNPEPPETWTYRKKKFN